MMKDQQAYLFLVFMGNYKICMRFLRKVPSIAAATILKMNVM